MCCEKKTEKPILKIFHVSIKIVTIVIKTLNMKKQFCSLNILNDYPGFLS